MKQNKITRLFNILFAGIVMMLVLTGLQACSKKTNTSKSANTASGSEAGASENVSAVPVEEKEGLQIKRDAAGNYVIHLLLKDLEAVKLMKPAKEGYVVWMVNENNVPVNIGSIEGANTWTEKKDKVKFEAVSAVKPGRIFITAETDLKTQKPGKQEVFTTRNF